MIAITNGKFFEGDALVSGQTIFISGEQIAKVSAEPDLEGCTVVDAGGSLIHPGFVDLQIYGSGGNLFSAYPEAATLRQMDLDLISKGTTGFLACVATNSPEVVRQTIEAAKAYREEAKGFLGLHLEGPFLNAKRKGAHVAEYIHQATLAEVRALIEQGEGMIRMMTMAAELQDDEVIAYLLDQGVLLSLGHSDASYAQANAAYAQGFKTTTHLFNAMPAIHHRAPALPAAVLNHPKAMASIIADGRHVDFAMVTIAEKLMGERLFLITDAVTPCSIGPYQHQLSGDIYTTPEGTLSGSGITLLQAVHNCVRHCGIPLVSALKMASEYPAQLIQLPKRTGKIAAGARADLLLLSEDFRLERVFAGGLEYPACN